jgi:ribosomal protein L30/L7E
MQHTIANLWSVDIPTYCILVVVTSIEVLGMVQAVKPYWKGPTIVLSLLFCIVCGVMQSSLTPQLATSVFNIVFCSYSIVTLASQAMIGMIKKIPEMLMGKISEKLQVQENLNIYSENANVNIP